MYVSTPPRRSNLPVPEVRMGTWPNRTTLVFEIQMLSRSTRSGDGCPPPPIDPVPVYPPPLPSSHTRTHRLSCPDATCPHPTPPAAPMPHQAMRGLEAPSASTTGASSRRPTPRTSTSTFIRRSLTLPVGAARSAGPASYRAIAAKACTCQRRGLRIAPRHAAQASHHSATARERPLHCAAHAGLAALGTRTTYYIHDAANSAECSIM